MNKTNMLLLPSAARGFTLLEIMVVVTIIGILLAAIMPNIIGRSEEAKIVKARQDVRTLEGALELYHLDNGFYPTQEQGLRSLVQQAGIPPLPPRFKKGGYIKRLPKDPWGNDYQYRQPGAYSDIDVFSFGADSREGGDDGNADIGNWN